MPLYEYECEKCGHRFDKLSKMTDPNPPCPRAGDDDTERVCGGSTKKLISRSEFVLKGGGWAKDGY